MSPNSSPNLPLDSFHLQAPKPEADANVRTETEDDASNASAASKVQQEVKEEFESISGGSRAPLRAQSRQASFLGSGRPYEPERPDVRQTAQAAPELEVPWVDVINELRSVQHSRRQLRTQVENVAPVIASETAVAEITSRQAALTTRMERLEACLSTVMQDQNNAAETTRESQTKTDRCLARSQRLNDRIRTQDWYHDLSEEESDEEIERQLAGVQQHLDQSGDGTQPPRDEDRSDLEQRFEQFRREQAASATEPGRSFVLIRHEF